MRKKIGEILVESGLVAERTIQEALNNKKETQKIGDYLIEHGYVTEELMYSKLSMQMQIPLIRMAEVEVSPMAVNAVPKALLSEHTAFPIDATGSLLTLAMENPIDDEAVKEIENTIGYEIKTVYGLKSEILDYISKYYDLDDSMVELFGMVDEESRNVNELQIADTFFQHITNDKPYSISIKETRNRYEIGIGDKSLAKYEKDLRYLVDFIKRITGYTEDKNNFSIVYKQKDFKILVELQVTSNANSKTYWIESTKIQDYNYTLADDAQVILNAYVNHDIIFIFDEGYKEIEKFKELLRDYKYATSKNVLVNTDDINFSSYDLDIINVENADIYKFSSFGDVFVLDLCWNLNGTVYDSIMKLLKKGKQVIIHFPYSKEYLPKTSLAHLVNSFKIAEHIL